jgi:hypothetical protein
MAVGGSSLSTYLDVTRAAADATTTKSSVVSADSTSLAQAAKLLAAIHAGTEAVTELGPQTGLDTMQVLGLLASLAESGMVELDEQGGTLRAHLTEPTRAALST